MLALSIETLVIVQLIVYSIIGLGTLAVASLALRHAIEAARDSSAALAQGAENNKHLAEVQHSTNSMREQLVIATAASSRAAGIEVGRAEGRQAAETQAEALRVATREGHDEGVAGGRGDG